jgi:hypothetical protein
MRIRCACRLRHFVPSLSGQIIGFSRQMSISRLLNNSRFLSCRRDGGHVAVKARAHPGENTVFFGHFYTNPNILPRQARDKHRESTQKKTTVLSQNQELFSVFEFWRGRLESVARKTGSTHMLTTTESGSKVKGVRQKKPVYPFCDDAVFPLLLKPKHLPRQARDKHTS